MIVASAVSNHRGRDVPCPDRSRHNGVQAAASASCETKALYNGSRNCSWGVWLLTHTIVRDAEALVNNVAAVVVAKREVIELSVASLLAGGHLLLNDLPGVGKTLLARSLASSVHASFRRVQFTPDLLPSDVTGSSIFLPAEGRFEFRPGPLFANIVLADEVNRASTRTQAALLEAMAEGQVTVDGETYPLPEPFWVVATQNEVDSYGTFPLPHAQLDRFMMSVSIGLPGLQDQVAILERNEHGDPVVEPMLTTAQVRQMQADVRSVEVSRPVREYIARIVSDRRHTQIAPGVSPRGGVHLQRAAQAVAAMRGDDYVAPEHVKAVAIPVLAHRIALLSGTPVSTADVIQDILGRTPVPT